MDNLGLKLRARRKERGLTLKQLSKLSGLHLGHISHIERGERFPTGRTLKKLAKPLDFTEVEILRLAGFLSSNETDNRMERLKQEVKLALTEALTKICQRIDSF